MRFSCGQYPDEDFGEKRKWNLVTKRRSHWCPQRIQNCEFAKGCVTPRSEVALLGFSESGEEITLNHINDWEEHQPQFRFWNDRVQIVAIPMVSSQVFRQPRHSVV